MQPSPTHGNASKNEERNPSSQSSDISSDGLLRGLRWRVKLGVLPSGSPSVAELRRAAADGRRRYAELRRRLLVDPHVVDELHKPHHSSMDNPLSQDPESVWVRYFQNAELEKTIDTDLTRLYPEHGVFFQSPVCQAMLRRILLVWSLIHPHYSYRQGMHEVLAPLLYVLHNDVVQLSKVKERYEDLFDDRFEDVSLLEPRIPENGVKQRCQSFSPHKAILITEGTIIKGDEEWLERIAPQDSPLLQPDEFGFDLRIMVLGSDTYGAEGELGALLSGRFVEHDTYSMFDALMSGKGGGFNLAEYFMTTNGASSAASHSPVLEASAALYRALAAADLSLYSYLVGLGVEPQYFALRWLRVLFGREFDLEKLLLLWDAIFSVANTPELLTGREVESNSCQHSHRRDFILALAVSMLLYLRPILLAAANATGCLQKLLNFPQTADVKVLIETAKGLRSLVEEAVRIVPPIAGQFLYTYEIRKVRKSAITQINSPLLLSSSTKHWSSPEILRNSLPESYWEEKWRNSVLQKGVPVVVDQTAKMVDRTDSSVSSASDQDGVAVSIASNAEGKQSLLMASACSDAGSGSEYMLDNDNKTVKRDLRSGLDERPVTCSNEEIIANGFDQLENNSDCRGFCGIQETRHDVIGLQHSHGGLETHTRDPNLRNIGGSKGTVESNTNMLLTDEDGQKKLNTDSFDNVTPRLSTDSDVISASAFLLNTTEINASYETSQGTVSTELPVDEEASAYKAAEKSPFTHAAFGESVVMNVDSKVQPLTHDIPLVSEDTKPISDSSMSASTSNTLPVSSQPGKFSWMWNFCKTGGGDKKRGSIKSKSCKSDVVAVAHENPCAGEPLAPKKEVLLFEDVGSLSINSPIGEVCSLACSATADTQLVTSKNVLIQAGASEFMTNSGVMNESAKDGCSSDLRILGQSISENVMVLESTLSLTMIPGSKERLLDASDEGLGHVLESPSSAAGRTTVQGALEELKKISRTLLQM